MYNIITQYAMFKNPELSTALHMAMAVIRVITTNTIAAAIQSCKFLWNGYDITLGNFKKNLGLLQDDTNMIFNDFKKISWNDFKMTLRWLQETSRWHQDDLWMNNDFRIKWGCHYLNHHLHFFWSNLFFQKCQCLLDK